MSGIKARQAGVECMFGLVLEVGDGRLEVGLERRRVGVEERKMREVVEETRAMVLEAGEGLLEVKLRWWRWPSVWVFGVPQVHFWAQLKKLEARMMSERGKRRGFILL